MGVGGQAGCWVLAGVVMVGAAGAIGHPINAGHAVEVGQGAPAGEIDPMIAEGVRLLKEGSVASLRQALQLFERAALLSRGAGNSPKEALARLLSGRIYNLLGDKNKALQSDNLALALYRAVGDRSGEAKTLNNEFVN